MNLLIKQKQTHRQKKKKTYGYQGGEGRDKPGVWD